MTLKNALSDTFGVSLYEEGAMKTKKDCAGWTKSGRCFRKITKLKGKDPDLVMRTETNFIKDCMEILVCHMKKQKRFGILKLNAFGNYGFN